MAEIQNGDITLSPKLSIEAILSVVPHKPTDPRVPRKIMVENNNFAGCGIYQRRFHMILYYEKSLEDNSDWLVVGRMKESLGEVLSAQPLFAARVRKVESGGDGELELVPNDSGVRFVKTKMSMTLEEFLNLKGDKEIESKLLLWENIDAQNPQFSPLLYVQVTDFKCGLGYSVGISCSLLLADPLALANFLTSWTKMHNNMFSGLKIHNKPLFYNPNLGEPKLITPFSSYSDPSSHNCKSLIFEFASKDLKMDSETQKAIAMQCIEEAERESGREMSSTNFSLLMKVRSSSDDVVVKVENFVKSKLVAELSKLLMNGNGDADGVRRRINWDYLQVDGISFDEGKQPVLVSCWINTLVNEGTVVVVIPSPPEAKSGINNFVVVVPNE